MCKCIHYVFTDVLNCNVSNIYFCIESFHYDCLWSESPRKIHQTFLKRLCKGDGRPCWKALDQLLI